MKTGVLTGDTLRAVWIAGLGVGRTVTVAKSDCYLLLVNCSVSMIPI